MFNSREQSNNQRLIEVELDRTLIQLKAEKVTDEEYAKTLSLVERLHKMLDKEKPASVSKDTMLTVGANLVGIILILKHEHVNVISSKALGFIMRPR
jgi:hypothetical protein